MTAPDATKFVKFFGSFGTLTTCCISGMEIHAAAEEHLDGSGSVGDIFRGSLGASTWQASAGSLGPVRVGWNADHAGFRAQRLAYFLRCADHAGCLQSTTGDYAVRGRSFEFTLQDEIAPEITSIGGTAASGGWLRGTTSLAVSVEDRGGGLAGVAGLVGEKTLFDAPSSCSEIANRYVSLRPCPLNRFETWPINTRAFSDGLVTLEVRADDVGGATDTQQVALKVDNTPPEPPLPVVEEGEAWRPTNEFTIRWTGGLELHAPIKRVHYEICALPDGICSVVAEDYAENVIRVGVPGAGTYGVSLWLEDAAGNVNSVMTSPVRVLKFDDSVPGRTDVEVPTAWLSEPEARDVAVSFGLEAGNEVPVSGIAGYSVTTDGTQPDGTIDVPGRRANLVMDDLPEGMTVIKARAISGAGIAAPAIGSGRIAVDRTQPSVRTEGLPHSSVWHTQPVLAEVVSADQPGLSGVEAAPLGGQAEDGGYITLELDDDTVRVVPGHRAVAAVASDGNHTLTYRAFDAAGNASVEKEAKFKIDQTAPVGAFRALSPTDPRQLKVDVADATSGVRDGQIEYRRIGETGFRRLETKRGGGVLSARIEDEGLPAGRYELRAVATDEAGNRAVIDSWADGSAATVGMPLRIETRVEVAGVAAGRCAKATKNRRGKRQRRKRTIQRKCRAKAPSKSSLRLAYGKRARSTGRLTTQQGAAIADASIVVEGRARSGGTFVELGTTRTDGQGRFRFTIPAGPSRAVRYRYDGTNTTKPAAAKLTTKVSAAARLRVDRRRLRNGQVVRFIGRLLGKPIPSAGKVVAIQAKVGRKWRTFATPRANRRGVFKHGYRFTATTGLRRYRFRAVVAREAAYPYEAGVSRILRVTVKGR